MKTNSVLQRQEDIDDIIETDAKRIRDWESATYSGLMLAFGSLKDKFSMVERHHILNVKPREIDVIIISDADFSEIDNPIAHFFRKRNIIELKNPTEALNIDIFCNVCSYALQYKANGRTVDEIKLDEITLTIFRASKPAALFENLQKCGYNIVNKYSGIYYIFGVVDIPIQVVVGMELLGDEFLALRVLKRNALKEDLQNFILFSDSRTEQSEKEMVDAVLQISISENREVFDELIKEDERMCQAMRDLMKPEFDKTRKEREEEMAMEMLRGNEPISKIEKYTKVATGRITEIAKSIGVKPVLG